MKVLKYGGLDLDPSKLSESTLVRLPARNKTALKEAYGEDSFVMPRIEAIHAGRTKNFTHYPADKLRGDASLKSGVHSWLNPYGKPVIYNHDVETEVTGRIVRAAYAEYTQAGRPGIIVVPKITEPHAVQALRDGRLLTVSIGATTDAAICSICGTDIVNEGFCGHMKGEQYDGITAEWITGNLWFDELSWVNVPADQDAVVTEIDSNILMPTENSEVEEKKVDKKIETLNEYYRIPANITLVEAAGITDVERQEGIQVMEKDLDATKEVEEEKVEATKEDEVKVETPEVEVEAEPKDEVGAEKDSEDKVEAPAEDEALEDKEKDEEAEVKKEEELVVEVDKELEESKAVNVSLQAQVDALTNELREHYKKEILSKVDMQEEAKASFAERIQNRSLESLKESLSDIEDGFYATKKEPVVEKKVEAREVKKVDSPIKVVEKKQEDLSESQRVSFFKTMLSGK